MSEGLSSRNPISRREFLKGLAKLVGSAGMASAFPSLLELDPREFIPRTTEREREPEIVINFFHDVHVNTPEKVALRDAAIDRASVVIVENSTWNEDLLEYFNRVSSGEIQPSKAAFPSSHIIWKIHSSDKRIYFLDPIIDDPIWQEYQKWQIDGQVTNFYQSASEFFADQRSELVAAANLHQYREKVWMEQLVDAIAEVRQDERYQNLESVNIMVMTGISHEGFSRAVEAKMPEITTGHSYPDDEPYVKTIKGELLTGYMALGENPPERAVEALFSDQNMARMMLETLIVSVYGPTLSEIFIDSFSKYHEFVRELVDTFNYQELLDIYDRIQEIYQVTIMSMSLDLSSDFPWSDFYKSVSTIISAKLKEKDIDWLEAAKSWSDQD